MLIEEEGCPGGISGKPGLPPELLYHHTPWTDESPSGRHVRFHVVTQRRTPLKLPVRTESRLLWWRADRSAPDRAVCQQRLLLLQSRQGAGASAHEELHSGQRRKKVGESDLVMVVPLDDYQPLLSFFPARSFPFPESKACSRSWLEVPGRILARCLEMNSAWRSAWACSWANSLSRSQMSVRR